MPRTLPALLLAVLTACPVLAGPGEAVAAALADVESLPADVACRTRYLSAYNLSPKEWAMCGQVLNGWANHLSTQPDVFRLRPVAPDLWAVVLDDAGWRASTWDAQADPYFYRWERTPTAYQWRSGLRVNAALMRTLMRHTHSVVPIVRADFWLFYASRAIDLRNRDDHGFGYLDWLQLRKRADVDALAGLEQGKAIKLGYELRALLEQGRSGVVQLDRQIEWFGCYGEGSYWRTLDTFDNGKGNVAPANLEPGAFRHQAEEIFFLLPNKHWGLWLGTDKGVKQNTAPDQLGGDDSPFRVGRDTRIGYHSCLHCHTDGGLRPIDDWARRSLKSPKQLDETDYARYVRLKRQYFGGLDKQLARDRAKYEEAIGGSSGLSSGGFARAHAWLYYRYLYLPRTPGELAKELGCNEELLLRSLRAAFDSKNGKLDAKERRRMAPLVALLQPDPQPLPTTYTEQLFDDLACLVRSYP